MLQYPHNLVAVTPQLALPAVEHVPFLATESDAVSVLQLVPHLPEDVSNTRVSPVIAPSRHDLIAFDGQSVLIRGVEHNGNNGSFLSVAGGYFAPLLAVFGNEPSGDFALDNLKLPVCI